jgi:transposase-like protein
MVEDRLFSEAGFYAEGPYCPNCMRELNENSKRTLFGRKEFYTCPLCRSTFPKTDNDEQSEVERDFMALLRQGYSFERESAV